MEKQYKELYTDEEQHGITVQMCMENVLKQLQEAHLTLEDGFYYAGSSMGEFHWYILMFAKDYDCRVKEIITAYEEEDWENYRIRVHALKSNARRAGARILAQQAYLLEQMAAEKNVEGIRELWPVFLEEWKQVAQGIRIYMGDE